MGPQEHNNKTLISLEEKDLPDLQPDAELEIRIQQVNFADGPSWEDDVELSTPDCSAAIDGEKRIGIYPAVLNQALFYEASQCPSAYDPLNFQVDWTNISETSSIIGLIYRITARRADGSIVNNGDGESCTFVSCYYEDPSQWIPPSSDNKVFNEKIPASVALAFRENHASVFEISIYKVIDSYGIIWEAPAKPTTIEAVLTGKKGYFFSSQVSNKSVQALLDQIEAESLKYDLQLGDVCVSIKDKDYCLLRYEDVDIRVELSDQNEVLPNKIAIVYYSVRQYDNFEVYVQSILNKMDVLRRCICSVSLTDVSSEDIAEALQNYKINTGGETYFQPILFGTKSYNSFEMVLNVLDENSNVILCDVFAVGEDLYYPPDMLFWVRESPWEEETTASSTLKKTTSGSWGDSAQVILPAAGLTHMCISAWWK